MYLKLFFLVCLTNHYAQGFTTSRLGIVKSMSDELVRRQIIIVKNVFEETNKEKLVQIVKYFSNFKIYTTFHSVNEMNLTLYKLVSTEWPTHQYHRKTIAIIGDDELPEIGNLYLNLDYNLVTPRITWLAFGNSSGDFIDKINATYIPYDCHFLLMNPINYFNYEVIEIYQINEVSDFSFTHVGMWNKNDGFDVPVKNVYAKRFDLNGTTFGVYTSCKAELIGGYAFCPHKDISIQAEIITVMSKMMNFRCAYVYTHNFDSSYNRFLNDFPNSVIEFFIDKIYLYLSSDSASGLQLRTTRNYLHVSYHKIYEKGISSPLIRPFTQDLWFSIGAWILFSTLTLLVIHYTIYRNRKSSEFIELFDICFASFECFTNQCGSGNTPKAVSSRIAMFMIRIPPLFLVLAYSGIIISFITVRIITLPFQDPEGLIKDGSFKIGNSKGDKFTINWFKETNDPVMRLVRDKFLIEEEDLPDNVAAGIGRMCNDQKFSFMGWDDNLFNLKFECDPLQIPSVLFTTRIGLNIAEASHYETIFSQMMYKIRSVGILKRTEGAIFYFDPSGLLKPINGENYGRNKSFDVDFVAWDAVETVFILLGTVYVTSIIILLLECLVHGKFLKKQALWKLPTFLRASYFNTLHSL